MPDRRDLVEDVLTSMAGQIAWPPAPDLTFAVRERLAPRRGPKQPASRPSLLRFAIAALVLAVAATGVLVFSPAARHAVAGWLGLPGIRIQIGQTTPPPPSNRSKANLYLGPPTTLARAEQALGVPLRLPTWPGLASPQATYADQANHIVWLTYAPAAGLPSLAGRDLGLLLTEIRARGLEDYFYKKLTLSGQVRNVQVGGYPGFWIHGQPHTILYRSGEGGGEEVGRVSGNALIWVEGAVTYRLELNAGLGTARAIAVSLR